MHWSTFLCHRLDRSTGVLFIILPIFLGGRFEKSDFNEIISLAHPQTRSPNHFHWTLLFLEADEPDFKTSGWASVWCMLFFLDCRLNLRDFRLHFAFLALFYSPLWKTGSGFSALDVLCKLRNSQNLLHIYSYSWDENEQYGFLLFNNNGQTGSVHIEKKQLNVFAKERISVLSASSISSLGYLSQIHFSPTLFSHGTKTFVVWIFNCPVDWNPHSKSLRQPFLLHFWPIKLTYQFLGPPKLLLPFCH